ncbi:cytosolic protein [Bacillus sp. DJP31]|uniref:cytosolic protein n=1 Tax=Bacillus sp. DJP31 TaxID=3409789 RepID=UPI003BB499AC
MVNEDKQKETYTDFSNVEAMRNYIVPNHMPEGPYGCPIGANEPVQNKHTPWKKGQRTYSAFNYEFKNLHQDIPRQYPGAHPNHDDPDVNEEPPNTTSSFSHEK